MSPFRSSRWALLLGTIVIMPSAAETQQTRPDPSLFQDLQYRMVGPSQGGRVTAVAGDATDPGTFYFGATGGGVWKTEDYGHSWRPLSDGFFETGSIGAIAVAPSRPRTIYVGTGSEGLRSNVIGGRGVYRSDDGGETWRFLGLRDAGQIGAVLVHPDDPDVAFVAALGHAFGPNPERGVFRTRDGGRSWQRVLYVSDSTGAVDLEFAPDDPDLIYASMWRGERKPWTIISGALEGGVFRSTDGGTRWQRLSGGLPTGLVGKSDLAVSPAEPDRLYVLIEAEPGGGLYVSNNRGRSFRLVNDMPRLLDRPFYYTNVHADPSDADVVYVMSTRFFRSEDGGRTFRQLSAPHSDHHDIWVSPDDPDLWIEGNDGGAFVTRDGGATWTTQFNQPTAELYQIDIDDRFPYWIYAGQQDNGNAIAVPSLPPPGQPEVGMVGYWRDVGGCETGPAVPKPGDPDVIYANCKGRFTRFNRRTGQEQAYYVGGVSMYGHNPRDLPYRFQRVVPIEISPHDATTVYHASQFLHVTHDEGVTWETISPDLTAFDPETQVISGGPITRDITGEEFFSTIYAVEESPLMEGLLWVGANDGPIHVTRDGGGTWKNVTPPDLPRWGRVQSVEPSPHRPEKAYVAVLRYLLDDWEPYIYRTTDYGESWIRLTTGANGIPPDYPTRVVREDPEREGLLYAGTEFGVYVSFDDGAQWQPLQQNLPAVPVTDIEVYRGDLVVSTMGRGFWIMHDITPLRQLDRVRASAPMYLFQPRDAFRLRYQSSGGELPPPARPKYPAPGAVIDYYLGARPNRAPLIEILSGDSVVHHADGSRSIGHHRYVWDLRLPGPWNPETGEPDENGPMALPGNYTARVTVDGVSAEALLVLRIDPRVEEDGVTPADLAQQLRVSLEVRDALSLARRTLAEVRRRSSRVGPDTEDAHELAELERRLTTRTDIRYPPDGLVDQLRYLYGMNNDADQRLGRDVVERLRTLAASLDSIRARLAAIAD